MNLKLLRWFNKRGLSRKKFKDTFVYRVFGERLLSKSLWRFEKGGVIRGWIVGCYGAFNPFMGGQILLSSPFILFFRANVFVAIALIFVTNPITYGPFLLAAYLLGSWLMGIKTDPLPDDDLVEVMDEAAEKNSGIQWSELFSNPSDKVLALLLGCFVIATVTAIIGAVTIKILWKEKPDARAHRIAKKFSAVKAASTPKPAPPPDRHPPQDLAQ